MRAGLLQRPAGNRVQATCGVVAVNAEHEPGDVHAGLEPTCPAAGIVVEAGVFNGHARGCGKRDGQPLVFGGEVAAVLLLGEVEVAEHHVADPDRNAQEGLHGRVVIGEPEIFGMCPQILQAHRPRIGCQHAVADGQRADAVRELVIDADGDKVVHHPVVRDHAQGAVARVQQLAGRFDDTLQDGVKAEVLRHGNDGFEQAGHTLLRLQQLLGPRNKALQHTVDSGLRLGCNLLRSFT
ncbi:hypothetical protein QFZ65_002211 [Arthrobacter sp. B3I9]|nr:hypothetical protein [Arthrobacter sp. B3I9]